MSRKAVQGLTDIELEVSDFGPVARGKIALRPLTVFVGPNNSGKSYASILAHSVISACADLAAAARSGDWAGALMESGELRGMSGRAARLAASCNGREEVAVPRELSDAIHRCTVGRLFEESLVSHLGHNFGSPLGALVRTGSRSSRIRIGGPLEADVTISRKGEATVRTGHGGARYSIRGSSVTVSGLARNAPRNGRNGSGTLYGGQARRRGPGALHWLAAGIAGHATSGAACGASKYIPAARYGAMRARGAPAPGVPGGPRNGGYRAAGTVLGLAGPPASLAVAGSTPRNGGTRVAEGIMAGVFGGRLGTHGREAGALSYAHGETRVPMHMSSSGVSGTAALALAASGMGPGDTLVVEEPEAHLHPRSQVRLATQLAGLVRRGMRVILSTHSPFLLEQLSILVQLEALTPAKRKARGYGTDDYVAVGEVAPYAFGGSAGRGYTVSEVEHSVDMGIVQDEFVKVSESMSKDEYGIYVAQGGE